MIKAIRYGALLSLCALLFCDLSMAADPLWLSSDPPKGSRRMGRSHGGPVEVRNGVHYKHLWLRQGEVPTEATYVREIQEAPKLLLLDTAGKISEKGFEDKARSGSLNASFPMPAEGFYNAYVTLQRLDGDVREVTIAKAEVLKHSCREGHDNIQEKMSPRHNGDIPLEIVRDRRPKEDFHARLGYGDRVSFTVLRNGAPLPGARVVLTSGQGWSKGGLSDAAGQVEYAMIRDYYPPWNLFEKRHAQPYLVRAFYTVPQEGELEGEPYRSIRYQASFSGNYYPSPNDYESYAYGLTFGLFALVATGLGIYLYRQRRNRPYREVRFHE